MRVRLTVEVDAAAWRVEYGCEPADVRDDVRSYLRDAVQQSTAGQLALLEVVALEVEA